MPRVTLGLDFAPAAAGGAAALARDPLRARAPRPILSTSTPTSGSTCRASAQMFSVVQRAGYDAVGFMLDCPPRAGRRQRLCERGEGVRRRAARGRHARRGRLLAARIVVPGHRASCAWPPASCRCRVSARRSRRWTWPARSGRPGRAVRRGAAHPAQFRRRRAQALTEHEGKSALAAFGVPVPRAALVAARDAAACRHRARLPGGHQGRRRRPRAQIRSRRA